MLMLLPGCNWVQTWQERENIRESLAQGQSLLIRSEYDASIKEFEKVLTLARDREPSDAALYNIGVIYVLPYNSGRNPQKALHSFKQVVNDYPASPWRHQGQAWINLIDETRKSKQETEVSKQSTEDSRQEVERIRQEAEKYRQQSERRKAELDRMRQEVEKTRLVIEKSRQVDIEIEQKKRDRGR
ncbi:MAG: hypothetical protein FJ143_12230 [Deltaproteobacteria bacterium]|nr:hypothetical protein [Deltaproteobacteria bacterium]MBM4298496.1 hypothetical protein [Deltaproteobacteria bacterium]